MGRRIGTKIPWLRFPRADPQLPAAEFGQAFLSATPSQKVTAVNKIRALDTRRKPAAPLDTPTDLSADAVSQISPKMNEILATTFALYLKTKNFHWPVSGPHFRDYHCCSTSRPSRFSSAPMISPNVCARSAASRCGRSARSPSCRASRTTTRAMWPPATCCAS
jgi:hypothetical protein